MLIFITDEGRFWNHKNPILEKYADCVRVVCLNGKKVTDKYKCIVSPYNPIPQLGMTDYGVKNLKYEALKSIKELLRREYSYHDDIVFLTDSEPQSLYPYLVLKDMDDYNKLHLWCITPWRFEVKKRKSYFEMLDMEKVTSIHYVESDEFLKSLKRNVSMSEAMKQCQDWLNSMLPSALYEIDRKMAYAERYYYDLNARRYINTDDSYANLLNAEEIDENEVDDFIPFEEFSTLGLIVMDEYPDSGNDTKELVEKSHPRIDGKMVCERLKQMRRDLAEANDIELEIVDCPSTGPCAGTCAQCDKEIRLLQEQLMKIQEGDRKYPQVDIVKDKTDIIAVQPDETEILMGIPIPTERFTKNNETVKVPGFLKAYINNQKDGGKDE